MPSEPAPPGSDGDRVVVLNPASGDGQHTATVYDLAGQYDFEVRETDSAEDVVETAAAASTEAAVVAAAGGDGTLTRVVRGIDRADALDSVQFGIVPAGTGNGFAGNLGITGLEHAFEVIEGGERRRLDVGTIGVSTPDVGTIGISTTDVGTIDVSTTDDGSGGVGTVDGTPFLNSVVAGLTAESSADTDPASKERWGVLAYAMTTASTATNFEGLHLRIDPVDREPWECDAGIVLIGNGRRFPRPGGSQAHVEDGLLDVAVVEQASALQLAGQSLRHAIGEADGVAEFRTPSVAVEIRGDRDRISVDGEIETAETIRAGVRERVLDLAVGEGYDPSPDGYDDPAA